VFFVPFCGQYISGFFGHSSLSPSRCKMSKNQRRSATHHSYYHDSTGTQVQILRALSESFLLAKNGPRIARMSRMQIGLPECFFNPCDPRHPWFISSAFRLVSALSAPPREHVFAFLDSRARKSHVSTEWFKPQPPIAHWTKLWFDPFGHYVRFLSTTFPFQISRLRL
jgi:hypothetical protein